MCIKLPITNRINGVVTKTKKKQKYKLTLNLNRVGLPLKTWIKQLIGWAKDSKGVYYFLDSISVFTYIAYYRPLEFL